MSEFKQIGITKSGVPVYGAGSGLVSLGGGRTISRERLIKDCDEAIKTSIAPTGLRFVADPDNDIVKTGVLKGRLEGHYPEMITMTLGFTLPIINCLECNSPATHGNYCAYCERSVTGPDESYIEEMTPVQLGNRQARARIAASIEREKPPITATSREMAKAHPWEEFE